jgi:hypothetical protein
MPSVSSTLDQPTLTHVENFQRILKRTMPDTVPPYNSENAVDIETNLLDFEPEENVERAFDSGRGSAARLLPLGFAQCWPVPASILNVPQTKLSAGVGCRPSDILKSAAINCLFTFG